MRSKSIEQLENDIWKEPDEFPSGMVENCFRYRKIILSDLTVEQIRLLISQKIGLEHLIELALEKLDGNILSEGNSYEGDLLEAVSRIPSEFWIKNDIALQKLRRMVVLSSDKLKKEVGEKNFDRICQRIKPSSEKFN